MQSINGSYITLIPKKDVQKKCGVLQAHITTQLKCQASNENPCK
jgi:hypothetical protein